MKMKVGTLSPLVQTSANQTIEEVPLSLAVYAWKLSAEEVIQLRHDLTMQWHHNLSVPELDLLLKTQRDWLVGRLEASRKPRGALADFPRMAEYIRKAFPDNEYINSQYRVLAWDIGEWRAEKNEARMKLLRERRGF